MNANVTHQTETQSTQPIEPVAPDDLVDRPVFNANDETINFPNPLTRIAGVALSALLLYWPMAYGASKFNMFVDYPSAG